jgi:two-component system CheB/CheR fusion protein
MNMKRKTLKSKRAAVASVSKKSDAALIADEKKHHRSKSFPIVAIGASAGGLEAITQLLKNLSPSTGMAYVYIQHLDPLHESMLSNILSKSTRMPVLEAKEKMLISPDHVYVIPPNKDMMILDGVLKLNPRPVKPHLHMPVNRFFMSLAEKQKEGAIGIVLSGNANDGTLGLKAIKAAGGITFAQDETAKFRGMPDSAITEGTVDLVMPPDAIAHELERLSKNPESLRQVIADHEEYESTSPPDDTLTAILHLLHKSIGIDFYNYKKSTVVRRIERRMLLHKLPTLKDYFKYLNKYPAEINMLFNDLLINVTSFFRDPELCNFLQQTVLPKIIKEKAADDALRIWIPACSTGQEAYSIGILIKEVLGSKMLPIQIFASDLSENAIVKARLGIYSKSEVADISLARLQKYFIKEDNHYRVVKSIRDMCVFATHNIFKDPPFSRVDIVSCCNLLIYLDPGLQKKAISIFHYALNDDGYLVLGKTESVGSSTLLFAPLKKKLKIYQRKNGGHARATFEIRTRDPEISKIASRHYNKPEKNQATELEKIVDNLLLSRYVPPCVVVNDDLEIIQFRGSTGLFLEPSPGKASLNLIRMAREGLGFELRNAIHKVSKSNTSFKKSGIEIKDKNASHLVGIEVVPMKSDGPGKNYLVLFEEEKWKEVPVKAKSKDKRVQQLEHEILAAREDMSAIIEEREAMNEELQSANEEVVSNNEELQSVNEELETSKEEIESTNEELQTINQELQARNDQLSESLQFSDAVMATLRESLLVLDRELRVVRANGKFYNTFKTTEEETENRLIYELGEGQWNIPELKNLLEKIIPGNEEFSGFEVNHVFPLIGEKEMILNARRIEQPRLKEKLILLAIEDITDYAVAQRILKERELWFRNIADSAPVMIWTSDENGNRTFFNKTWLEFTGRTLPEEVGMNWIKDINPIDRDEFLKVYTNAVRSREPYSAKYRLMRKDGQFRWMQSSAKPFYDVGNQFIGFIGTVTEIHDQKLFSDELERKVLMRTEDLKEANRNLQHSNSELQQFAYVASHDLQEPLRKMIMFSERLQKKFKPDLPETAQQFLDVISKGASRMTNLIDDLLQFSRAVQAEKEMMEVDLNKIVKRNLNDFDLTIQEKNATIHVDELPVIVAVPIQMHQLFHNLISNALKFTSKSISPKIEISARELSPDEVESEPALNPDHHYCDITISDNGIGLSSENSDKVFDLFSRLHGKNEYPGTGIGLALCRRIVNNHKGVIYVESEEGKGATFHVIMPLNHAE